MLYNRETAKNLMTNTMRMADTDEAFEAIQRCERLFECESIGFLAEHGFITWTVEAADEEVMEEVLQEMQEYILEI
jgi:hypothetical protein